MKSESAAKSHTIRTLFHCYKEKHDGINRSVEWVNEEELLKREFRDKLNYRLLFKDFLNYLYKNKRINNKKNKSVDLDINNEYIYNISSACNQQKFSSNPSHSNIDRNFFGDFNFFFDIFIVSRVFVLTRIKNFFYSSDFR